MPRPPQMDLIAELKKRQMSPLVREGKDGAIEDIITGTQQTVCFLYMCCEPLSGGVSYTELTLPRQQKDAAMQLQVRVVLKLHSDSYVIKVQTLYQVKFSC